MGVTSAGIAESMGLIGNTGSPTAFTYLALGDTATAFAVTQTALANEITGSGLARASATVSRTTTTYTDDTLHLSKKWDVTGTETVREVGVFNAASAGDMLARKVTKQAYSLANLDDFTHTYDIIGAYQG